MRARRASSLVAFTSLLLAGLAGCAAQPQTAGEAQATADVAAATTAPNFDAMPSIRAAFYYPWYPETWKGPNGSLFTNYTPIAGLYDSGTLATIRRHVDELVYANIDVAISSWWGPGTPTAARFETILNATTTKRIHWSLYYEREGYANPTTDQIVSDLAPVVQAHATDSRLFRLNGRFVVFVYAGPNDNCAMASRWAKAAQQLGIYVVLKVFNGYKQSRVATRWLAPVRACKQCGRPAAVELLGVAGLLAVWRGRAPPRDPTAFRNAVKAMVATKPKLQLITTFNEWGEGTAVEPTQEWPSPSGDGVYLDILHDIPPR